MPSLELGAGWRCGHQALPQVCEWIAETAAGAVCVLGTPEALHGERRTLPRRHSETRHVRWGRRRGESVRSASGDGLGFLTSAAIHPLKASWPGRQAVRGGGFRELVSPVPTEGLLEVCACVCTCACLGLLSLCHGPTLSQRPRGASVPARAVSYLRRNYPWCVRSVRDASYKDNFFLSIKSCLTDFWIPWLVP